ncbi:hypothetical protein ON010_g14459 [Phytophthora cinnamomi]|nr:hypothetical protein ON010_g14459 [Phytophthora cinnamomi]
MSIPLRPPTSHNLYSLEQRQRTVIGLLRGSGFGARLAPNDQAFASAGRATYPPTGSWGGGSAPLDKPSSLSDLKAIMRSAKWYILYGRWNMAIPGSSNLTERGLGSRVFAKTQTPKPQGQRAALLRKRAAGPYYRLFVSEYIPAEWFEDLRRKRAKDGEQPAKKKRNYTHSRM